MKKIVLSFLGLLIFSAYSFAQDRLMIVYIYQKDSKHYKQISKQLTENKYLAKRVHKNFQLFKVMLGTKKSQELIKKYGLENTESVYFIEPKTGKVLYKLTDLSKPCKCANLVNYFSRKLHKKNIDPDRYLKMAEKLGAYQKKVRNDYLF